MSRLLQLVPLAFILFLLLLPFAAAQNATCEIDQGSTRPGGGFDAPSWLRRGICVRNVETYAACRSNLQNVLDNLDSLHAAEYSAAATVLALLPTVGSLFGTPTAEMWMLFTVLPFGGSLALLLNFGGSLMPTKLEDYEEDKAAVEAKMQTDRDTSNASKNSHHKQEPQPRHHLSKQYQEWLRQRIKQFTGTDLQNSQKLPTNTILVGLVIMAFLLLGALAGMALIEVGAVYTTWCTSVWWFHLWWLVLTTLTIINNWATLPFDMYATLYLSDIPGDYQAQQEAHILEDSRRSLTELIYNSKLGQLKNLKLGTLSNLGSIAPTTPKDTELMVLISIARDCNKDSPQTSSLRYGLQIFLNLGSITVFVFATSIFAAVTLLALPMSQMILMLVVGSAIISRVLVRGIVESIQKQGRFLHVIVATKDEASEVLAVVFNSQQGSGDSRPYQIEIGGNIFINGIRIKSRTPWLRRVLGLMAGPHDIRNTKDGYGPVPLEDQDNRSAERAV